jgi:hypothetical protein
VVSNIVPTIKMKNYKSGRRNKKDIRAMIKKKTIKTSCSRNEI